VTPERGDGTGDGPDAITEGARALAEVGDDTGGEPVAETIAEPAQLLGRIRAWRRRFLDLDPDHRAARSLDNEADLPVVVLR
jgi:hypothetical protein